MDEAVAWRRVAIALANYIRRAESIAVIVEKDARLTGRGEHARVAIPPCGWRAWRDATRGAHAEVERLKAAGFDLADVGGEG